MSTKVMRGYFLEKQSYVDLYAVIIDKRNIGQLIWTSWLLWILEYKVNHRKCSTQTPMALKGNPHYVEL